MQVAKIFDYFSNQLPKDHTIQHKSDAKILHPNICNIPQKQVNKQREKQAKTLEKAIRARVKVNKETATKLEATKACMWVIKTPILSCGSK